MPGDLKNIVEAVLLVSDSPLTVARIQGLFERGSQPSADEIRQAIGELQQGCEERGVALRKVGNGYRYQTRRKYADWIGKLHAIRPPRLSRALLETLAIIAYRQPVTRGDIEQIRGVGVTTDIMRRLLEREWIAEVGVRDLPGHPALFGTTAKFLSYFDIESLKDLPPLAPEREFSEIAREMDMPLPPELQASSQDTARPEVVAAPPDTRDDGTNGATGGDEANAEKRVEITPGLKPAAETEQQPITIDLEKTAQEPPES